MGSVFLFFDCNFQAETVTYNSSICVIDGRTWLSLVICQAARSVGRVVSERRWCKERWQEASRQHRW